MGHHYILPGNGRKCAPLAQLDRVADFESVGRGFESLRAHQDKSLANTMFAGLCCFWAIVCITLSCKFWVTAASAAFIILFEGFESNVDTDLYRKVVSLAIG